ncbi:MAG TPA: ribosome-associated translation inhibitor RaiA [Chloroflexota bacterium]|nr:ribosome-associated translation inhibitor RaiA [Chloroflexota bacterium]
MRALLTKHALNEPMQITVSGRNMPVTPPLEAYVTGKMNRLTRYLDRLSRIEVVLAVEHTREASGRNLAEATAILKGRTIRAEAAKGDMYAAVDAVVDKLHQQLTRTKERTRHHKGRGPGDSEPAGTADDLVPIDTGNADADGDDSEAGDTRIVEVKQLSLKPMFADEAIDALEQLGHAFFVFLNARTEQVSVVYRRHDQSYGLIEPGFE